MTRDLVIRGGTVVTMDPTRRVVTGDLMVADGTIAAIGSDEFTARGPSLDASGCLVIPGLIQSHIHMCQTLMRGRADDLGAAIGALCAMLTVFALARGPGGWTPTRLLLTGVVVASGCGAMVSLLLALSDDARLKGMLFWLMGDLAYASSPWTMLALLAVALPLVIAVGRPLNVLARGELTAQIAGLSVRPLRIGVYVGASLLTAAAVTTAGSVGFVGLVTPHLARLWLGSDHRIVAPAAALMGGTLVVIADLLARTIVAPRQLPVGALTAIVGVPLFLSLMSRQRNLA